MFKLRITSIQLILWVSGFITLANNRMFLSKAAERLDIFSFQGAFFVATIFGLVFLALVLIHFVIGQKYLLKPLAILFLFVSAGLSYFNQQLGVIFDVDMIRNMVETIKDNNQQEALELLSAPLLKHLFLFALLPALLVLLSRVSFRSIFKEQLLRFVYLLGIVALVAILLLANFKNTVYFSRENRDLRYFVTPLYAVGSLQSFISSEMKSNDLPLKIIGDDAVQTKRGTRRTIGIMVVGETARADHFSLNGYDRETNPKLKKEDLINYLQASSCGTSTAYSVPCMFSFLGRDNYSPEKAAHQSNSLDVLTTAGVKVFWLDNNSSCKGVCERTGEIDLRGNPDPQSPFYFDGELFDEALISKMDDVISVQQDAADILIVLHTLGSHGPKYYKRYPDNFSKFEPACQKGTPQACSDQEIINAYDNTILYTDHVLSEVIKYLKDKQSDSNTFMVYASDHGESLGEKGVYLHGLPYFIAPAGQTHIPMFMWLSPMYKESLKLDVLNGIKQNSDEVSHDNLFHTLLGAYGVQTSVYKKEKDLLRN